MTIEWKSYNEQGERVVYSGPLQVGGGVLKMRILPSLDDLVGMDDPGTERG